MIFPVVGGDEASVAEAAANEAAKLMERGIMATRHVPRGPLLRRTGKLFGALALAGAVTLTAPANASAGENPSSQVPRGGETAAPLAAEQGLIATVMNSATRRCLDDSPEFGVRTERCNQQDFQKWRIRGWDHISGFELQNVVTGLCLDDSPEHKLRTFGCGGGTPLQAWNLRYWDHWAEYQNVATGLCLDDNFDLGLRTVGCRGGAVWQRWWVSTPE